MSDDLHDLLVRTADRPNLPLDAASLVGRAHRRKRATRAALALGATAVVAVASVVTATTLDRTGPRLEIAAEPDGDDTAGDEGSAAELLDRVFVSEERLIDGEPRPLLDGSAIRLIFWSRPPIEFSEGDLPFEDREGYPSFDEDADGALLWDAGCNQGRGQLEVEGDRLQVVGFVLLTAMYCHGEKGEQDAWLRDFLESEPSWQLDGDRLVLSTPDATVVLREDPDGDLDRPGPDRRTWVPDAP